MKLSCSSHFTRPCLATLLFVCCAASAFAQTDCSDGNGVLDPAPPKNITAEQIIQKVGANETKLKEARNHYTYTQDVMIQTLTGAGAVDGQMHEVTNISYDAKGKRVESVTFAEQSTLRGIQLTAQDMEDIRVFMPWMMTSDELPQYKVTYTGQQHVDDLDTYVFHVEPKQVDKNKRYFEGRVWVDREDLAVVKHCGKTVPEIVNKKKKGPQEIRPTFVTFRQLIDGNWFPVYSRIDDKLQFRVETVHLREVVKFTNYKKAGSAAPSGKP